MITRRAFVGTLAGGLLTEPLAVEAQQAERVPRIGYRGTFAGPNFDAFRQALRELGSPSS